MKKADVRFGSLVLFSSLLAPQFILAQEISGTSVQAPAVLTAEQNYRALLKVHGFDLDRPIHVAEVAKIGSSDWARHLGYVGIELDSRTGCILVNANPALTIKTKIGAEPYMVTFVPAAGAPVRQATPGVGEGKFDVEKLHWFGGKLPQQAMVRDLEYMKAHHLDPAKTMSLIAGRMREFAKAVDRNNIHGRKGDYDLEEVDEEKGLANCPFNGDAVWGGVVRVTNRITGAEVYVNDGTAHMAEKHLVLEKGDDNPYSTSVEEFLTHFMGSLR